MTGFSRSPRLLKAALVAVDPADPLANVVVFQYNPDSVTRTLRANAAGADADRSEALRLKGPPSESISMDVEIDATDQLETGDPVAGTTGLHTTLASIETMLYPKAATVIANEVLAALGVVEVVPASAPLTLMVWGPARVLPVRLGELTITEEAFDTALNPIRAKVSLRLEVLTYDDLGVANAGGALSLARHVALEVMGRVGSAAGLAAAGSINLKIGG